MNNSVNKPMSKPSWIRGAILLSAAALLPGGCSLFQGPAEPLAMERDIPFDYAGRITPALSDLKEALPPWALEPSGGETFADGFRQEKQSPTIVAVTARFLVMDRGLAEEMFDSEPLGVEVTLMNRQEADRVVEDLTRQGRASLESDSLLSVKNGKSGMITVLNQVSYVNAFSLAGARSFVAAEPKVEVACDGRIMAFRPEIAPDRKSLELEFSLLQARLIHPLPVLDAPFDGGKAEIQLQVPLSVIQQINCRPSFTAGNTIVVAGLDGPDPDEVVLTFIHAEVTEANNN